MFLKFAHFKNSLEFEITRRFANGGQFQTK